MVIYGVAKLHLMVLNIYLVRLYKERKVINNITLSSIKNLTVSKEPSRPVMIYVLCRAK